MGLRRNSSRVPKAATGIDGVRSFNPPRLVGVYANSRRTKSGIITQWLF